jgi:cation:H+ antiporter
MIYWIGFVFCTAIIVYSGSKLSKYGDIIAEKTGLGRTLTGVILIAAVTSLPELITGISSVTYAGVPDIAVGNVLGACVLNMLLFAFLDAFHRPKPLSSEAHHGHILSAGFVILLLGIVATSLFLGELILPLGWIGPYSLLFIFIYLLAMKLIYAHEKREISAFIKKHAVELRYKDIPTRTAFVNFGINAVVVIAAAMLLPKIGEGLAEITGLGQTFVGNIFIAFTTTLPEAIVSLYAIRMGSTDLAIGNILGSNIFNVFILAIDDIFFIKGPLLSFANPDQVVPALSAICMTTVAVIGLTYHTGKKKFFLAWDSIAIIFFYIINVLILYSLR